MVKVFDKLISTEEGAMGVAGQEEFQISSDIDEIENPNQEGVINQISQNLCCQGFRSVKNNVKCKNKIENFVSWLHARDFSAQEAEIKIEKD